MDFAFESAERCRDCGAALEIYVEDGRPMVSCAGCGGDWNADFRGETVHVGVADDREGYIVTTTCGSYERHAETVNEVKALIIAARSYIWGWTDRERKSTS